MKLKLKLILMKTISMSIILILLVVSCQKEFIDIREPYKSVAITANDTFADLISKVVLNDGSYDNIIDRCSEICIKFPYSINIDNHQYTVNSPADIDSIKMDHFFAQDDKEIIYPISISFSDHWRWSSVIRTNLKKYRNYTIQTLMETEAIPCILKIRKTIIHQIKIFFN